MIEYDSRRWRRQLFAIHGSIAPRIAWRVAGFVTWSVAVLLLHRRYGPTMEVPATVHTLIGVALGLLLVFRTNASYDRFWEGRRAWGSIVNNSRNLVRAARGLLAERPGIAEAVAPWVAAFPYACMHALRGGRSLGPVASRLPPAQVAEALAAPHVPLAVATRISRTFAEMRGNTMYGERVVVAADAMVRSLIDDIGTCERIQRTPLPFAYVVHLRRALILYCVTLPFALVGSYSWSATVYTLLITYILFGIEEIGVEIENPFGTDANDLPLEQLCETIERDVLGASLPPEADGRPHEPALAAVRGGV